jgi:BirA family biotin operon repressor/biotin-[acetyl-CoA-carboxylase] ligase
MASTGAARVLGILDESPRTAHSGEVLSDQLGVSRAQIWKHVERLRDRGYTIEGERGGGYMLTGRPDRLYPEELQAGLDTRWLAQEIHYFDTTDSTNRIAFDLARQGAAHGTTVVAEGQTAGRGRLGRSFFSPQYLNVYTSIILRPELDTVRAPTLIPSAAIAVAEAIGATIGDPKAVEIKWPNDVQLAGLKTSGILMEMSAEATRVDFAILGIGVNLNVEREELPEEFRPRATSLRTHTGQPIDRAEFVRQLYTQLERIMDQHALEGFAGLRPRYEARFQMQGQRVRVADMDGTTLIGTAIGITDDGALQLERDDGAVVQIIAGDVTLVRPETG